MLLESLNKFLYEKQVKQKSETDWLSLTYKTISWNMNRVNISKVDKDQQIEQIIPHSVFTCFSQRHSALMASKEYGSSKIIN